MSEEFKIVVVDGGAEGPPPDTTPKPSDAATAAPDGPGVSRPLPPEVPLGTPADKSNPADRSGPGRLPDDRGPGGGKSSADQQAAEFRLASERARDRELKESLKEFAKQAKQDKENLRTVANAFGLGGLLGLTDKFHQLRGAIEGVADYLGRLKKAVQSETPEGKPSAAQEAAPPTIGESAAPAAEAAPEATPGPSPEPEIEFQEFRTRDDRRRDRQDMERGLKSGGHGMSLEDFEDIRRNEKRAPEEFEDVEQAESRELKETLAKDKAVWEKQKQFNATKAGLGPHRRGMLTTPVDDEPEPAPASAASTASPQGPGAAAGNPPDADPAASTPAADATAADAAEAAPDAMGAANAAAAGGEAEAAAGAIGGMAEAALAVVGPLAAVAAGALLVYASFRALDHDARDLAKQFKNVDPRIAVGETQRELQEYFNNMQRSAQMGDSVNSYLDASQNLDMAFTQLIDAFRGPLLDTAVPILNSIADAMDLVAPAVQITAQLGDKILAVCQLIYNYWEMTDSAAAAADDARERIMKAIETNTRPKREELKSTVDALFKMDAVNPQQAQKWVVPPPAVGGGGGGMMFK